ncbi:lipocalin family protein [Jejuia pallidilutea]|uniref:Lipocalin-like protein n=1 Tax=Jejuia pallidilutea TaxID=504487 RepID=A0A090VZW5_9FLAO|nr:lipocalin family protein [Jejuia pallidilutea]GAL70310.1 hypothetical protein JCM19302_3432 [Jejuia pallidilutea]GAL90399.1 hypothetical protein JCM19538_164 [Jejuia pallidilutea]
MKKIVFAVAIIFCFVNMRCEPNEEALIDANNLLIGHWAEPKYNEETITLTRVKGLPEDGYGISILDKNNFVERSSGFCGTPPLTFSNYEGKWQLTEDVITINQDHFPNHYAWRILSLTENELVLTKELTEQEKDYRALMDLFDNALELVKDLPCQNSANWTFTPYGSKACGGPQWFVAYPTTIDTEEFLKRIEAYTKAEQDYNLKWSVFSTCDIVSPPKAVVCENGFPIFKF